MFIKMKKIPFSLLTYAVVILGGLFNYQGGNNNIMVNAEITNTSIVKNMIVSII